MGDVVNLKRFKKRTGREASAKQAEANRARFGRTKSERVLDEASRPVRFLNRFRLTTSPIPASIIQPVGSVRHIRLDGSGRAGPYQARSS